MSYHNSVAVILYYHHAVFLTHVFWGEEYDCKMETQKQICGCR